MRWIESWASKDKIGLEGHSDFVGYLSIACNKDVHVTQYLHLPRYNMTKFFGYPLYDT
jgi:hypothetical protein